MIKNRIIAIWLLLPWGWVQSTEPVESANGWSLSVSCAGCHGTFGESFSSIPSINGMDKEEFIRKLSEFKEGVRPASVMDRIARGFDERDFEKMAIYFARQKRSSR